MDARRNVLHHVPASAPPDLFIISCNPPVFLCIPQVICIFSTETVTGHGIVEFTPMTIYLMKIRTRHLIIESRKNPYQSISVVNTDQIGETLHLGSNTTPTTLHGRQTRSWWLALPQRDGTWMHLRHGIAVI